MWHRCVFLFRQNTFNLTFIFQSLLFLHWYWLFVFGSKVYILHTKQDKGDFVTCQWVERNAYQSDDYVTCETWFTTSIGNRDDSVTCTVSRKVRLSIVWSFHMGDMTLLSFKNAQISNVNMLINDADSISDLHMSHTSGLLISEFYFGSWQLDFWILFSDLDFDSSDI